LSEDDLKVLSQFNGPSMDSWTYNRNASLRDSKIYFRRAKFIIYPELQNNRIKEIKKILVNAKTYSLKVVSVFHDAVPVVLKDYYSSSHAEIFLEYMNDLSQSDFIFSVSESSNKDYKQLVSKPRNSNLKNIALLSPHNIKKDNGFIPKINNTKEIKILFVSSIIGRKNHVNFLKAYSIAQKKLHALGYKPSLSLIAADVHVEKNYLEEFNLLLNETETSFKTNVSEEELKDAYRNADFTVYPSVYEGYGLPIAESLSSKTPVACSNTSSMKEIAEFGGCITFDPYDIDEMANAIFLLSTDSKKRNDLVKEIESIKEYSWKDYALDILKTIGY
jgi:glycosyltransferase involved in cell wall biosynthesis